LRSSWASRSCSAFPSIISLTTAPSPSTTQQGRQAATRLR
jgi:hypothetical protein